MGRLIANVWIRRLILIGGICVLVLIGMVIYNGMGYQQSAMSSPKSTIDGVMDAYQTQDVKNVIAYFTPIPSSQMKENLIRLFRACDSIKMSNVDVLVIYQEGLAARVQVSWDMETEVAGEVSTQHFAKVISMVKIEKKWYINQII